MKISVFITSYNQRDDLCEAIDSVLAQTLPASQIIVVDDASSDGSQDLIADYARRDPGLFTPIYHRENSGVARVRVDALNAVTGDHVTYVDGDDWFLPEKLEQESAMLLANPKASIAFSNNAYMTEDGATELWRWVDDEPVPQGCVLQHTFGRAFPRRSLFRMELVDYRAWCRIGFHDPKLALYEDFDMRIRLTQSLEVVYVDQVLSRIRTHGRGLSRSAPARHFLALDYLFQKNRGLLADLPMDQREQALAGLSDWIARMARPAIKQALRSGRLLQAARLVRDSAGYRRLALRQP